MKKLLTANWKMTASTQLCEDYAEKFAKLSQIDEKVHVVVCPPAPFIHRLQSSLQGPLADRVEVGAQDASKILEIGAHTGEVHPQILRALNCRYAIIGHSERRQFLGESDEIVGLKVFNCLKNQITPILCVGESMAEREGGRSEQVIRAQLDSAFTQSTSLKSPQWPVVEIAYEPFWAIGSGQAASPETITKMHAFIRRHCLDTVGLSSGQFRILYGGSVNRKNVAEIAALTEVDGALVGGASLAADHFAELAISFAG